MFLGNSSVRFFLKLVGTIVGNMQRIRSSRPEVLCKKGVLRNFAKCTRKHLCQSLFFNKAQACNFIKKDEISKNTFSYRTLQVAASEESVQEKEHNQQSLLFKVLR